MSRSENVRRIQPSATIAVGTLARRLRDEGRSIVNLSAGEPDFATPYFIAEAGMKAIERGETRYTPAAGLPELRRAIAERTSEEHGRQVDPSEIVVSCGAKHSIFNAVFSLFGSGDEVLLATPYWTSYPEIVRLARAEPAFVPGDEGRSFRVSPAELEGARTGRSRGLILSSPCNPTGALYPAEELRSIAEWAKEHGIWVISDEIYRKIRFGSGGAPAPGLLDLPPDSVGPSVVVNGVSKAFSMTGWRIGYSISEPDLAATMSALQSHVTSNPSTPAQHAALAAFSEPSRSEAAVREMVQSFERRRDLVIRLLSELLPEVSFVMPEGAFYLFFKVDGAFGGEGGGASEFCTRLLEEVGVALVPGEAFGDPRYVRLSFAAADDVLEEGIRRMATMVAAHAGR